MTARANGAIAEHRDSAAPRAESTALALQFFNQRRIAGGIAGGNEVRCHGVGVMGKNSALRASDKV
ncbi:hypothetical protein WME98_28540 [Sorangium sp. So ce296]|uniref:hypothetical protein n=1 Tax=Sorangium sp. So ce296 TaxID=3133296 RepID=UPI003F5E7EED